VHKEKGGILGKISFYNHDLIGVLEFLKAVNTYYTRRYKMKTKIYTIFLPFFSKKKNNLIGKLQNKLGDVEFIGFSELPGCSDMTREEKDEVYRNIKQMKDQIDGILVFGGYLDKELTSIGLPVIMVSALLSEGDWEKGIVSYYRDQKVITACLSYFDISQSIFESRFEDLIEKIKLISAIKKAKETRLLVVQEPEVLGNYDIEGMDYHVPLPMDYNKVYAKNLKDLGLKVKHASLIELNEEIGKVNSNDAGKIADMWINEAKEIKGTNRDEVLKAAKMYIGIKQLMKKHDADGIAMRSLIPHIKGLIDVTPCLVRMELNKQLKVAVCEGLVNSAITEMFGISAFGRPSFIGDVVGIDKINDVVTFAHCQCPINPHGSDKVPYIIRRSHAQNNKMLPDNCPRICLNLCVAVQVELPTNEIFTSMKFSIYDKKIAINKGISVSGEDYYNNFEDASCRNKIVLKTNTEAFEKNYDTATFGVHRNLYFGDYTSRIKDLATLIGFNVIEENA